MGILLWNHLHKKMGIFSIGVGRHEMEEGVINHLSILIVIFFKGLYPMGKREKPITLPGIALALSMNRELIRQHRQSQIPSDEREKE